jgi:hypothetical protein
MCHKEGTGRVAIRGGVVCNDIENDLIRTWKEEALSRGYQSLIAHLKKKGKVIGNFNFTPVRKLLMLKKLNY